MRPYFADGQVTLYHGHVMDVLRELPAESVQCVVTSPPYWSLRAYGTEPQVWGGDAECEHEWTDTLHKRTTGVDHPGAKQSTNSGALTIQRGVAGGHCPCGAWRGELGHEPTPMLFVEHMVGVFREVHRVLRDDGVCWINIGDSYNAGTRSKRAASPATDVGRWRVDAVGAARSFVPGGKAKDLVLMPERLAIALQDDGWYIRSRIAWCKRTPMPESVRDRPTNAWEPIWMLSKSQHYFWDSAAAKEPTTGNAHSRGNGVNPKALKTPAGWDTGSGGHRDLTGRYRSKQNESFSGAVNEIVTERNVRNYWHIAEEDADGAPLSMEWLLAAEPCPEAHFATFPSEIPRRCIAMSTREGDTVLDPFVGSGTSCQVARSLGRRSIGIELNETYLRDIALKKNAQMALMLAVEEAI